MYKTAYFERDWDLIKREIGLLNPDVIICCDKSGIIYNKIVSIFGKYYEDIALKVATWHENLTQWMNKKQ